MFALFIVTLVNQIWSRVGVLVVTILEDGLLSFKFPSNKARDSILANESWHFGEKHIMLRCWAPDLVSETSDVCVRYCVYVGAVEEFVIWFIVGSWVESAC